MLRTTTTRLVSRINAVPISSRFISNSPIRLDGASKQGMGEKVSLNEKNPVTARAETAKNAAKSVAEGVKGIAKSATGGEASKDAMEASGKYQNEQEVELGRKEGVAKKGDEKAAPK